MTIRFTKIQPGKILAKSTKLGILKKMMPFIGHLHPNDKIIHGLRGKKFCTGPHQLDAHDEIFPGYHCCFTQGIPWNTSLGIVMFNIYQSLVLPPLQQDGLTVPT